MNGFLDELEHRLIDAVERDAEASPEAAPNGRSRLSRLTSLRLPRAKRPLSLLGLAALLALGTTAAALAATGVIFSGAPVPPPRHLAPRSGVGIPAPGRSRLIARSASDPAGGLPWGMRIVHTTRGVICLQVGRQRDGQIGVLGEDGAFHDDGLFHRISAAEITPSLGPNRFAVSCNAAGVTSEQEVAGMPESGELVEGKLHRLAAERRIYFGLLGPNALSITYRADGKTKTVPVEPGTGAYLFVARGSSRSRESSESGGGFGYPTREEARIRADAPLISITYRLPGSADASRTCVEAGVHPATVHACPRETLQEIERKLGRKAEEPNLHVPIDVTLKPNPHPWYPTKGDHPLPRSRGAVHGVYYEALVSFKAPIAVANADSGYTIGVSSPRCHKQLPDKQTSDDPGGGVTFGKIERDVHKGEIVNVRQAEIFANDLCGGPVTIEISYDNIATGEGELVGTHVVHEP